MLNIIIFKCISDSLLFLHTALIFTLIKLTVVILLERTYFIGDTLGILFYI